MEPIDQETLERWVDLDYDEAFEGDDKLTIDEALAGLGSDARKVAARHNAERLHELFAESNILVDEGFTDRVMESLPQPAWSKRSGGAAGFVLPAAIVACFAIVAAVLTRQGFGAVEPHALGIAATVLDFLQASILAGAGLLFVSWRGVGIGLEEILGGSPLNLLAFASVVVFLDLLLLSLLRRRSRRRAPEHLKEP